MDDLRCPNCNALAFLETQDCAHCRASMGFHLPSLSFIPASADGYFVDGVGWAPCSNRPWNCNWLVCLEGESGLCFSCRLTRRRPDSGDTVSLEKLADVGIAKRRLLVQLFSLGLPVVPYWEKDGGLAFDLLSSLSGEPVVIGHADGVITIDLAESIDARREAIRARLGEPYRTMLGHLRHEVGHYYQGVLVAAEPLLGECRALFGDERISYSEAIERHYRDGAPGNWAESYISEYATMHPWEDFAETFAHYLHITGTLATAALAGVVLSSDRLRDLADGDVVPLVDYSEVGIERALDDWHWLSLMLNRVNRTMGQRDLYPFIITRPVIDKLTFMHRAITGASPLRG